MFKRENSINIKLTKDNVIPGKALFSSNVASLKVNLMIESDSIPCQIKIRPTTNATNDKINFKIKTINSLSVRFFITVGSKPLGMLSLRKFGPLKNMDYLLKEANST